MKNFFTEINQTTIERQKKMFGELFVQAVIDNPNLLLWVNEYWKTIFKKKSDQEFLKEGIEKLKKLAEKKTFFAKKQSDNLSKNQVITQQEEGNK